MAQYTEAQLESLWIQAGGDPNHAAEAAAIALAESGGNSLATNNGNSNGSVDRGLWQINSVHGSQSTFDPLANARAAVAISDNGTNWRPWCVAWSNGDCSGDFLGPGSPVLRLLSPFGSAVGQAVQGGVSGITGSIGNTISDGIKNVLAWLAAPAIRFATWTMAIASGICCMLIGIFLILWSAHVVQGAAQFAIGRGTGGGSTRITNTAVDNSVTTVKKKKVVKALPAAPTPPTITAGPSASTTSGASTAPAPLFPVGRSSRARLGRDEDILRAALRSSSRYTAPKKSTYRRKATVGYKGRHRD